jgi:EAL and modified HD-GYP domain-containing signal transduction protein
MVGLFSLLDVILEMLEDLMAQIAVSQEVIMALQHQNGVLYQVCLLLCSMSNAWEEASDMAQDIGLPEAAVTEMMNKATGR